MHDSNSVRMFICSNIPVSALKEQAEVLTTMVRVRSDSSNEFSILRSTVPRELRLNLLTCTQSAYVELVSGTVPLQVGPCACQALCFVVLCWCSFDGVHVIEGFNHVGWSNSFCLVLLYVS